MKLRWPIEVGGQVAACGQGLMHGSPPASSGTYWNCWWCGQSLFYPHTSWLCHPARANSSMKLGGEVKGERSDSNSKKVPHVHFQTIS